MEAKIYSIDELFKARVKPFIRTKKGKMERVKEFERKREKKAEVGQRPFGVEVKKIGHATYAKLGDIVGEIKGPYRPGGVWKTEIYHVKSDFDTAWQRGKVVQDIDPVLDRQIAAITWGQTKPIDVNYVLRNTILGYKYKSKLEAVKAMYDFMNDKNRISKFKTGEK